MAKTRVFGPAGSTDTQFGNASPRTVPIDFFAYLTSTYNALTGYSWSELRGTPGAGFAVPPFPLSGNQAYDPAGRTDFEIGTICRLSVDRDQTTLGIEVIEEGTGSGGPTLPCVGCGWIQDLRNTDCLKVSLLSAAGACACASGVEDVYLASIDGESWGSPDGGGSAGGGGAGPTVCCPGVTLSSGGTFAVSNQTGDCAADFTGSGSLTRYGSSEISAWDGTTGGVIYELYCNLASSGTWRSFVRDSAGTVFVGEGALVSDTCCTGAGDDTIIVFDYTFASGIPCTGTFRVTFTIPCV